MSAASQEKLVREFNERYPPGTHVRVAGRADSYVIRAKAQTHSSGTPQVWLLGEMGSVALHDIAPCKPKQDDRDRFSHILNQTTKVRKL